MACRARNERWGLCRRCTRKSATLCGGLGDETEQCAIKLRVRVSAVGYRDKEFTKRCAQTQIASAAAGPQSSETIRTAMVAVKRQAGCGRQIGRLRILAKCASCVRAVLCARGALCVAANSVL